MKEFERKFDGQRALQEQADNFFKLFDGKVLKNSENKTIKLRLVKLSDVVDSPVWIIQFEGYPEADIIFLLDYDKQRVTIQNFVTFEHPDLKSKGIFSQIRRLVGQNFPQNLEYCIDIRNERAKKQLLEIRKKYKSKFFGISLANAENQVLNNYWIQEEIAAGFNNIRVVFEGSHVEIIERKIPFLSLEFKVDFD